MLSVASVSFRYRGAAAPALRELSVTIPDGMVYGLLGPNGAGKTTLISLIAGLASAERGSIDFSGRPLAEARADDPTAIALVPQDHAFYPMLTVRENLRCFGGVLGLKGALLNGRIDAAIAFARLEAVIDRRAGELSGGLKRRLNLAIGLLGQPKLLLLDEPTVGVDPQSRAFLLESVAALPAAGTSVIYTSHYMEEVEAICGRVAIIDGGRVLAEGSLDELTGSGQRELELTLDRALPPGLAERFAAQDEGDFKFRLFLPSTADLAPVLAELTAAGCDLREIKLGRPSLEQLFMRLTQRTLRD